MKRLLTILFLLGVTVYAVDAQLLEDNDSRLKTKKSERSRSNKKLRNSKGIPSSKPGKTPRYSSVSSPFRLAGSKVSPRYSSARDRQRRYSIIPRYSGGNPFRGSDYKVTPRYSFGNPFRGSQYKVSPRYSGGNPFRGSDYRVTPRYSQSNPFRGSRYKVSPRYSQGSPFRGKDHKITPRYSSGMPFKSSDYKITPRYSAGNPFKGERYNVRPRYSQGMPFSGKDHKVSPRYSQGMPFRGKDYNVKPRYSAGSPFSGVDFKVRPRYTGTKISFFRDRDAWGKSKLYQESSLWEGDLKLKNKRIGDQHPSSNYHIAMRFSNPKVRKMFRKWNIYWTRINGNKQNSNGVNEKVKEPKFDKKERVIWNN